MMHHPNALNFSMQNDDDYDDNAPRLYVGEYEDDNVKSPNQKKKKSLYVKQFYQNC